VDGHTCCCMLFASVPAGVADTKLAAAPHTAMNSLRLGFVILVLLCNSCYNLKYYCCPVKTMVTATIEAIWRWKISEL
jgi:hypothetical protein